MLVKRDSLSFDVLNASSSNRENRSLRKRIHRHRPDICLSAHTLPEKCVNMCSHDQIPARLHHYTKNKNDEKVSIEDLRKGESVIKRFGTFSEKVGKGKNAKTRNASFILCGTDATTEFYLSKAVAANVDCTYKTAPTQ